MSSTMCTIALVVLASVVYVSHGHEEAACTAFPSKELLVGGKHVMMQQKKNQANRNIMTEVSTHALPDGEYTIQQKNTMMFLDAWQDGYNDYRAATRPGQDNDSQKWVITATDIVNGAYTIQQKVNMRFLDAYEDAFHDYRAATREAQDNDSQKWVITATSDGAYTIQQKVNMLFLDAYEDAGNDYGAAMRQAQDNDSQKWLLILATTTTTTTTTAVTLDGEYTMQQMVNMRFLDAYEDAFNGYRAATREAQDNDSQKWVITATSNGAYTIQQKVNMFFLDAYEDAGNDYGAAMRQAQDNDSQKWVITVTSNGAYTIQQKVNMRFLDAYEDAGNDYRAATREAQDNDSQKWLLISLATTTTTTTAVSPISMFKKIGMGVCLKADGTSTDIGWAPCTSAASGDCLVVDGCADDCMSNPDCASFMYYDGYCWLHGGKTAQSVYTQTSNMYTWYSCYAVITE